MSCRQVEDSDSLADSSSMGERASGGLSGVTDRALSGPAESGSFDRYDVLDEIGRGAMGAVFKVIDRELDDVIAIKVLHPHLTRDPRMIELFKREVRLARRVVHPNVARVYHFFRWHSKYAIAQEYVPGTTLEAKVGRPWPVTTLAPLLRELGSALQAAHDIGLVHRDFKPSNVLVDRAGRSRIVDFGVAVDRAVATPQATETIVGTAYYVSPEQIQRPTEVDHRADIYALGVVLFQLTTGRLPFPGADVDDVLTAHVRRPPPRPRSIRPDIPEQLESIILRCLEKDPDRRFQSAGSIHRRLGLISEIVESDRPKSRGTVLVIDDDIDVRDSIANVFIFFGANVVQAGNGQAGLSRALEHVPDLILLDLSMPLLDGHRLLDLLRANPKLAQVPVVVLSALSEKSERRRVKERGAAMFLSKPPQIDVLRMVLDRFVPRPS